SDDELLRPDPGVCRALPEGHRLGGLHRDVAAVFAGVLHRLDGAVLPVGVRPGPAGGAGRAHVLFGRVTPAAAGHGRTVREARMSTCQPSRSSASARSLRASVMAATQSRGTRTLNSRMCASWAVARMQESAATPVSTSSRTLSLASSTSSGVDRNAECLGLRTK